ncbi:MAG: Gfo/Idh/MocA family oxidoreductase [Niabella sp.]
MFEKKELNIPICIIGAGGIVSDAHLPAYKIAGFHVKGITNRNMDKAKHLALQFHIPEVYQSVEEMVTANGTDVIYDFALPASEIINVILQLPEGATVLIQKPLGESIEEAKNILDLVNKKKITAGVNFQMRFAPFIAAAKQMIANNEIGDITDIEVYVNVYTPWNLWNFLFSKPRMEINYHSVHYVDLIRSFLGTPDRIFARTFKHPQSVQLASVRTNIIMDYGDLLRATIHTNHNHHYGYKNQQSYVKIEGTKGAIKIGFGALIDYPHGVPDSFQYITLNAKEEASWKEKTIEGTWFPHAFIGTMEQMQLVKKGLIAKTENDITDAFETMACVEAAYKDSEKGGALPSEFLQKNQ